MTSPSASDREVLVTLYKVTDGPNWMNNTNWLSDAPIGEWYGVSTGSGFRVVEVDLSGNNLTGRLPQELGTLNSMVRLALGGNSLSGEIPQALGNLSALSLLELNGNNLTGRIPSTLPLLENLEVLFLGGNKLNGGIPPELGNLTSLQMLNLRDNLLVGEIPPELRKLIYLSYLDLAENNLSGQIPLELGSLINLDVLCLEGNSLSGVIPEALGKISNLQHLSLDRNELSGRLPVWLAHCTSLNTVYLSGNQFIGCIPEGLRDALADGEAAIPFCDQLVRSDSTLGPTPTATVSDRAALVELYRATSGHYWNDKGNWLTDTPIGEWNGVTTDVNGRVISLILYKNNLTGELPPELGNLTNLSRLYLSRNNLMGEQS